MWQIAPELSVFPLHVSCYFQLTVHWPTQVTGPPNLQKAGRCNPTMCSVGAPEIDELHPGPQAGFEQIRNISLGTSSVLFLILLRSTFLRLPLLTFGDGCSFVVGAVLCLVGYLAASLASIHKMTAVKRSPNCDNQKGLQTLPNVRWKAKWPPVEILYFKLTRSIISLKEKITASSSLKISYSELP